MKLNNEIIIRLIDGERMKDDKRKIELTIRAYTHYTYVQVHGCAVICGRVLSGLLRWSLIRDQIRDGIQTCTIQCRRKKKNLRA